MSQSKDEIWVGAVWVETERHRAVVTNCYLGSLLQSFSKAG